MRTSAIRISLLLVFATPWEDAINITGVGTLTRIIGMLVAVSWLGLALVERRFRRPHMFHLFVYLFILWNLASFFWSFSADLTEQRVETYIQLGILTWILWDLYNTPLALRSAMQAYILGAYVLILTTGLNYLTGQGISVYETRFAGANTNANDLALNLALGLPIAWHLAVFTSKEKKSKLLSLINYAYVPAAFFTISLTASRMALFATMPAIFYMIGRGNRFKPLHQGLILAALIGTIFFIPESSIDRLATTGTELSTGDLGGRGILWRRSLAVFSQNPVLGAGSGALNTNALLGGAAHNTFLSVLAELGLIGFILFVFILAIVGLQAANQPKFLSRLWISVLAVWTIGVFSLTWECRKTTWLFFSLVVSSSSLYRRFDSARQDSPTRNYALVWPDSSEIQVERWKRTR
jgi:O-antigen ligase